MQLKMKSTIATDGYSNSNSISPVNACETVKSAEVLRQVLAEVQEAKRLWQRDVERDKRKGHTRNVKMIANEVCVSRTVGMIEALKWVLGDWQELGHKHPEQDYGLTVREQVLS